MKLTSQQWTLDHLQEHLQYAVDLEFWTIPFYMSAMYSIKDRNSDAFQLIQSVAHQEMLHVQLASNVANAYGISPKFDAPVYNGTIPHLDFSLDHPSPTEKFSPNDATIGSLNKARINAMCLVEYPLWVGEEDIDYSDDVTEYGSIAAFYQAVSKGAEQLKDHIKGGVRQVDLFSAYYNNIPAMTVRSNGADGFADVALLVEAICSQGEGKTDGKIHDIAVPFQNTADDLHQDKSHFQKFMMIAERELPEVYAEKDIKAYSAYDHELAENLQVRFKKFRQAMEAMFAGENPDGFYTEMVGMGAAMQNCWANGVVPPFNQE